MSLIRPATRTDFDALARLWHAGWHEAHAAFVPTELTAKRSLESFRIRLDRYGDRLRVAGPDGAPIGMCVIHDDELDQLFVAPEARGSGLAADLLTDGEDRLRAQGIVEAHLYCVQQNQRAARFYERQGWVNRGVAPGSVETLDGPFTFDVLRFEKTLVGR